MNYFLEHWRGVSAFINLAIKRIQDELQPHFDARRSFFIDHSGHQEHELVRIRLNFATELVDRVKIRYSNTEVNFLLARGAGQDDNSVNRLFKLIGFAALHLFDEVDKMVVQKAVIEMPFFDMLYLDDNSRFRVLGKQVIFNINLADRFEEFVTLMHLVGMKLNA